MDKLEAIRFIETKEQVKAASLVMSPTVALAMRSVSGPGLTPISKERFSEFGQVRQHFHLNKPVEAVPWKAPPAIDLGGKLYTELTGPWIAHVRSQTKKDVSLTRETIDDITVNIASRGENSKEKVAQVERIRNIHPEMYLPGMPMSDSPIEPERTVETGVLDPIPGLEKVSPPRPAPPTSTSIDVDGGGGGGGGSASEDASHLLSELMSGDMTLLNQLLADTEAGGTSAPSTAGPEVSSFSNQMPPPQRQDHSQQQEWGASQYPLTSQPQPQHISQYNHIDGRPGVPTHDGSRFAPPYAPHRGGGGVEDVDRFNGARHPQHPHQQQHPHQLQHQRQHPQEHQIHQQQQQYAQGGRLRYSDGTFSEPGGYNRDESHAATEQRVEREFYAAEQRHGGGGGNYRGDGASHRIIRERVNDVRGAYSSQGVSQEWGYQGGGGRGYPPNQHQGGQWGRGGGPDRSPPRGANQMAGGGGNRGEGRPNAAADKACYVCGEVGHLSYHCPQSKKAGRDGRNLPPHMVPCNFFNKPQGCHHGDNCKFLHEPK
jgi:hypothetical protein